MTRGDEEIIDDALDMLVWQRRERERLEAEVAALTAENERLRAALSSIARNSCCDNCQEAALVARAALAKDHLK